MDDQQKVMYLIDHDLAEAIFNYLATRPWGEVDPLVVGIQRLSVAKPIDPENQNQVNRGS